MDAALKPIIAKIRARLQGYDFDGEVLDDTWSTEFHEAATLYLEPDELMASADLDKKNTADEEICPNHQAVVDEVLRSFIRYLCKRYGVTPPLAE